MKQTYSVAHISHGITVTGGYLHEQFVLQSIAEDLREKGYTVNTRTFRTQRFFKGLSQFKMVWLGMKHASADINLVSNWMALYAIIGNLFSKRKIIITWHHHDDSDVKTRMTRLYMKILFAFLAKTSSKRVAVLVVSPYWANYFKKRVSPSVSILYFPNLFRTSYYQSLQQPKIPNQIYLGQYAFKTDERIFELAHQLKQKGYYCFFTTLIPEQVGTFEDYDILSFASHSDYLKALAQSEYTLAYTKLNEGWNRVAHESILVGTPVIGVDKGGLGDLLRESNSIQAETVNDFFNSILQHTTTEPCDDFIRKYDENKRLQYAETIFNWVKG